MYYVCRLHAVGLLLMCRLVEVDVLVEGSEMATRFNYDRAPLVAHVDRWYPETHMFHLLCGEIAPMLKDVSLLMGLPCAGATVGARDVGMDYVH